MDRQQRRKARRDLLKHGEAALRRGLPLVPAKDAVLGLALLLREMLADTSVPDRASRAAGIMHQVFEASLKAQPSRMEIACTRGCASCCHNWVGATVPELFLLARTIETAKPGTAVDRVAALERAGKTAGLGIPERFGAKLPCALLVDGACSQYATRPTVCRQVTSSALAACIDEYEGQGFNGDIVVSKVFLDHARNCRIPLQAALSVSGLSVHAYELGAGLQVALAGDAQASWLAGADPFAAVATAPADPEPVRNAIRTIAAGIAAFT
jgi:Putative zinc- or iron-chelating domain